MDDHHHRKKISVAEAENPEKETQDKGDPQTRYVLEEASQDIENLLSQFSIQIEIPDFVDKYLDIVDDKICSHESILEDDGSFLKLVNQISKLYMNLSYFDSGFDHGALINRVGKIQQRAMCYLEDEFMSLMEESKASKIGSVPRNIIEEALNKLGYEKIAIDDAQKMQWEALQKEIPPWITAFKQCVNLYFSSEPVATVKRSTEKLFKFLDIYETLRDKLSAIDGMVAKECSELLRNKTTRTRCRIRETAICIFCDLENAIQSDTGKTPVPRGVLKKRSKRSQIRVGAMAVDEGKVKIEKFDGADFGFWKMQIEDFLYQKNLYQPLSGKQPEGMKNEDWAFLDRQALGVIRLTLSRNVAFNIAKEKTTTGLMTALFSMYEKPSASNKVHLMRRLFNLRMTEWASVA
ncbi:hypothetical protein F3Y22_tig00110017pilonHSYRG00121 [Hibiscus syriacus]|uniref:Exocyst subunit Exo70 family protein n=1 Tax=Hibiscus syriacus TaxID=106335 RepID=A0A6A3BMG0_HIBSY|nr:hypothetical protein F3Y22_tig00110017pilonHSYRG00121 [Hibiscus syriacus]